MSKSLGNQTFPQDVIKASGADILRLWVASVDYSDDQRIGPEILKTVGDNYRKLRNTIRWMLGTLAHYSPADAVGLSAMGELERLMLHRLAELDAKVRDAYADFDYARVVAALSAFMNADLSAFYFDIRKDALYCEAPSSAKRRGALETIDHIFRAVTVWLAPILVFTAEEAWARARPERALRASRTIPGHSRANGATRRWRRNGRRSAASVRSSPARSRSRAPTSASARRWRRARASIVGDAALRGGARRRRFRRSLHHLGHRDRAQRRARPKARSACAETPGVAVVVERAKGIKCARSWRYFDPDDRRSRISRRQPARRRGLARTERGAAGLMRARTLGAWTIAKRSRPRPGVEIRGRALFRRARAARRSRFCAVPRLHAALEPRHFLQPVRGRNRPTAAGSCWR